MLFRSVKRIDTGIIGVNASFDIRGTTISLRIHVAQRSQARHANKNITQCAVGELDQAWLDRNLALAAGLRRYTLQLRQEGKLITPLGVASGALLLGSQCACAACQHGRDLSSTG